MKNVDFENISDMLRQARRDLTSQQEELEARDEMLKSMEYMTGMVGQMEEQMERTAHERDSLNERCERLCQENEMLKMKLEELQKMAGKVAEKTVHEDLLKTLRTYMNRSKTKSVRKRGWIKTVVTELALTAGLMLPEDMQAVLDAFDDDTEKGVSIGQVNGDLLADSAVKVVRKL